MDLHIRNVYLYTINLEKSILDFNNVSDVV